MEIQGKRGIEKDRGQTQREKEEGWRKRGEEKKREGQREL